MFLIREETAHELARLQKTPVAATAEQRASFAKYSAMEDDFGNRNASPTAARAERLTSTAGSIAELSISGVLVKNVSILLWLFGIEQTAYGDIIAALSAIAQDPAIKSVVLKVDSPGGQVDGLFEAIAALQSFPKPMSVVATQACSAAYALAAVAGKITAKSPASMFGSIGVAASVEIDEDVVDLTSTEAPKKRPDVTTEEGKATVVEFLDAIHGLFADAIASGRAAATEERVTVAQVNQDFGRGATLLAADAKQRGMIDSIVKPASKSKTKPVGASADADTEEENPMDLRTLKANHLSVYTEAAAEGAVTGASAERVRVRAHLTLGAAGGDEGIARALKAVNEGTAFDAAEQAEYMALALNKQSRELRAGDEKLAGAGDQADPNRAPNASGGAPGPTTPHTGPRPAEYAGGEPVPTVENIHDIVTARMMAKRGKKVG